MKIKNFNALAKYYDFILFMSSGRLIQNSQIQLLDQLPKVERVLMVGGGTGTFLLSFLKLYRSAQLVYIDSSSDMINLSRKKLETYDSSFLKNIEFICIEIEEIEIKGKFDLIITNFFLDLFEEKQLDLLVKKLDRALEPGGYWYYTDFQIVEQPLVKKQAMRFILKLLYRFFRITCDIKAGKLADTKQLFVNTGFEKYSSKDIFFGFINSTIYKKSSIKTLESEPFFLSEINQHHHYAE